MDGERESEERKERKSSSQYDYFGRMVACTSSSTQTEVTGVESSKHLQIPKSIIRTPSTVSFNLPDDYKGSTAHSRSASLMTRSFSMGSMLSVVSGRSNTLHGSGSRISNTSIVTRDLVFQWFVVFGIFVFVIVVVTYNLFT